MQESGKYAQLVETGGKWPSINGTTCLVEHWSWVQNKKHVRTRIGRCPSFISGRHWPSWRNMATHFGTTFLLVWFIHILLVLVLLVPHPAMQTTSNAMKHLFNLLLTLVQLVRTWNATSKN
ncbi:hypothetical protein BLOT_007320 [Blomia tropicalis]|nr:hypothetical protein BLOT_007320 [Blomia tropicalis]